MHMCLFSDISKRQQHTPRYQYYLEIFKLHFCVWRGRTWHASWSSVALERWTCCFKFMQRLLLFILKENQYNGINMPCALLQWRHAFYKYICKGKNHKKHQTFLMHFSTLVIHGTNTQVIHKLREACTQILEMKYKLRNFAVWDTHQELAYSVVILQLFSKQHLFIE